MVRVILVIGRIGFAVAVALLGLVACGGLPSLPSQGGPIFRLIETEHFAVYSDQPAAEAIETAEYMERSLSALMQHGWQTRGRLAVKLQVIIFDDPDDFAAFAPDDSGGYHVPEALFGPMVVMPAPTRFSGYQTLLHELTHFIAWRAIPNQPRWFSEGIACYFETARLEPDGRFIIGEVPLHRLRWLRPRDIVPASKLLGGRVTHKARFYANAWLLTHYLMSERGAEFAVYQQRLAAGDGHQAAWKQAFPEVGTADLQSEMKAYAQRGAFAKVEFRHRQGKVSRRVSVLDDADVYALRALLYALCDWRSDAPDRARVNIREALRRQGNHLRASALEIWLMIGPGEKNALAAAIALTRKYPDSSLAWQSLAFAELVILGGEAGTLRTVANLRRLSPRHYLTSILRAIAEHRKGNSDAALSLVRDALEKQPAHPLLLTFATAYTVKTGHCREAGTLARRLRTIKHPQISIRDPQQLEKVEGSCRDRQAKRKRLSNEESRPSSPEEQKE